MADDGLIGLARVVQRHTVQNQESAALELLAKRESTV